ncbi:MAG: hypothetical protein E5W88_25975, partial [Mesorhizobium sp.]
APADAGMVTLLPGFERGHFFLDPCNLHPGEAEIVAERLRAVLTAKERPADAMKVARKDSLGVSRWPD